MLKASIIIPTFNRCEYLRKTLESLVKVNFSLDEFEIIVCDNGSTDNTLKVVKEISDKFSSHNIHYFYEDTPGSLSARHRGFHESQSEDILIFTDDDVLFASDWLLTIVDTFRKHSDIHMLGGPSLPIYEGARPSWLDYFYLDDMKKGFCASDFSLLYFPTKEMFEIDPGFIWSLNLAIRKEVFVACKGLHCCVMPKEYQHFQGDGESGLTLKFREKNYKAVYHPQVEVSHIIPTSRMTYNFLDNRSFYQGVCNSYTDIRRKHGLYCENHNLRDKFWLLRNKISSTVKNIFKTEKYELRDYEKNLIKQRCRFNYESGYNFHQWAVKQNPELLKWVLKEDYFDYKLPEL